MIQARARGSQDVPIPLPCRVLFQRQCSLPLGGVPCWMVDLGIVSRICHASSINKMLLSTNSECHNQHARPRKHQQHTSAFCSVSASFLHALTYDPRRIAFATDGNMLDGRMICATSRLEQISSLHLPMIVLRRRLSTSINDCRLRALFGE